METQYFNLSNKIEIVYGAKRAAIYDLESGDIFSVDKNGACILRELEKGTALNELTSLKEIHSESLKKFLSKLQDAELGDFSDRPIEHKRQEWTTPFPRKLNMLWLELTECCNLKCMHCYMDGSCEKRQIGNTLSLNSWGKIIQEASELGCDHITFIGGEPFLESKKLLLLAKLATKLKKIKSLEIFTNGTIFKEDLMNDLIAINIGFAVSIYSLKAEIHDKITRVKGSFEKTMKTLDFLSSKKIPLRIAVMAVSENQNEFEITVDSLQQKYPSAKVKCDIVRPIGRGCSSEVLTTYLLNQYSKNEINFPKVKRELFWKRHYGHNCLWGKLSIDSTGGVKPCIMLREITLGNVLEQSLFNILNSEKTLEVWGLIKDKIGVCALCEFKYACVDCPPRTKGLVGNLYAKPPECLYNPNKGNLSVKHV